MLRESRLLRTVKYKCPRCWAIKTVEYPTLDDAAESKAYCDNCITIECNLIP
jgi:hypothetical protein